MDIFQFGIFFAIDAVWDRLFILIKNLSAPDVDIGGLDVLRGINKSIKVLRDISLDLGWPQIWHF